MDRVELKNLTHESEPGVVMDWDFRIVDEETRCFYKRIQYDTPGEKVGFNFCIVCVVGRSCRNDGTDGYFHPENDVEVLYQGTAYFDGIRHLYMGSEQTDNYGYDYYPNLELHIKAIKVLRGLELDFCREPYCVESPVK